MKKIIILFTVIFALLFYSGSTRNTKWQFPLSSLTNNTPSETSEKISLPRTLTIPKLKVQATIEYVGKDETGAMDVPKKYEDVAWYRLGAIPGAKGNAVIAGHYDSETGPAIFTDLDSLQKGDEIIVHSQDGTEKIFIVRDKKIYEEKNFPIEKVFGKTDKRRLNLITCEGIFNEVSKNYSHRTVIFSEARN
jgi:LPXTG-site transpeptidase (sortase) family protein